MRFFRRAVYTGRTFLTAVLIAITALNAFAGTAAADAPPVDLTLNNAGYTPIIVNNIKPGDNGIKTIELHNAGTKDGHVTIWLTDVVNGEGLNPESETGDTTGNGEMDAYFTLDLSVPGLDATLDLPATVKAFPKSATAVDYVKIIPLKAGQTKTLQWKWSLPASAGNDLQGDELSFTIKYLLQETNITKVTDKVDTEGDFIDDLVVYSDTKKGNVAIVANTRAKTADNQILDEIWLIELGHDAPDPELDQEITGHYYDAGPNGATFSEPITITLTYLPENIPSGVSEAELYIALWDEVLKKWVPVPGSVVNTSSKTVSAQISHFSRYTVMSKKPTVSPPPVIWVPPVTPDDETDEVTEPEIPTLEITLIENDEAVPINDDGTLMEALTFGSDDGKFSIELAAGSRISGTEGTSPARIDLDIVEIAFTLPDDTILLTPVYRLTAYDSNGNETGLIFDPSAILRISYDTDIIPENAFVPFIATYSDETGFAALDVAPNSFVVLGRTQALIGRDGYFMVAVQEAPPPPPLPAHFTASNLVITPLETIEGETVRISVTIANDGEEVGSHELYLIIDGIVRAIKEITLNPLSTETLTFEIANLSAGSHQIEVAHLTGTLRVERAEIQALGSEVNWLVIDFSVAGGVILGFMIWFFLMRRLRRRDREARKLFEQ